MSEIQALSLAIEEAVKEQIIKLEKRDRFNLKLQADQRRVIRDLRRQISEHTAYVNSGKQQIDMIKLALVCGKFDRETHLLEIVKMVPDIKHALCDKLECLLPWVHPMWVKKKITLVTGEDYAAACIALESLIMEAGRKD
tara:strand:+ start:876 stop:1295 length:420 start_codon:yes stop_codon:yes gene_type:complete